MSDVLRVVEPGLLTTIQDLGRPHAMGSGVSAGGAMDHFAYRAANLLVGNAPGAATLECTLKGPRLSAEADCVVAVAGADLDPRVNGEPVETWTSFLLRTGDELSLGVRRSGARAYVAVAGGIVADRWLGSMSTNLLAGRGGMHGRRLEAGDAISAEVASFATAGRSLELRIRPDYTKHELLAIPGPHFARLGAEGKAGLFEMTFTVSHRSDRMGYRLDGPRLDSDGEEVLSFGLVPGALQLPPGGRPILLMADHQTAGGYPVVVTVASASVPIAAQLAPGDELRFS
ncbi:MAG TPA: biotin-dependent carboxyltransferase family protein, partial [Candidatus Dormibacteraeota bacterium]|nr:biotin-dependent carboxyltransferase family protein [Candidatus Dormibacteraeota bacterium]